MNFDENNIKKNLIDYLILVYVLMNFILNNQIPETIVLYYFFAILVIIVFKFHDKGFIGLLTLSIPKGNRNIMKFIILIVTSILVSNIILFKLRTSVVGDSYTIKKYFDYQLLSSFLLINPIRMFGEEFIFRGLLLNNGIKNNKWAFGIVNVLQAILFSFIHSFIVNETIGKVIFTSYVFIFSIFVGWLNKKYDSLLPSILLHWGNGIQLFFIAFLS